MERLILTIALLLLCANAEIIYAYVSTSTPLNNIPLPTYTSDPIVSSSSNTFFSSQPSTLVELDPSYIAPPL